MSIDIETVECPYCKMAAGFTVIIEIEDVGVDFSSDEITDIASASAIEAIVEKVSSDVRDNLSYSVYEVECNGCSETWSSVADLMKDVKDERDKEVTQKKCDECNLVTPVRMDLGPDFLVYCPACGKRY